MSTCFAFQVVNQSAKGDEFNLATETMINLLLVDGAIEMLVESCYFRKATFAKIAYVASSRSVPSIASGSSGCVIGRSRILDEAICEDMIAVHLTAVVVDFLTINA